MRRCPCGNPDCQPGQSTFVDLPSGQPILEGALEGQALVGQPVLKTAQASPGEGSNPSPSAIAPSAIWDEALQSANMQVWSEIFDAIAAEGLDISQYSNFDTIKLVNRARAKDKDGVILLLGMIEGQTQKLKAEVKRLEAEVEQLKAREVYTGYDLGKKESST